MPILVNQFSSLADELEGIWNETAKNEIASMIGNQLFGIHMSNHRTWQHLILHGIDPIRSVAEGQELPETQVVEGDSLTVTQARYGGRVAVTKDMRLFDRHDQIVSIVQSSAEDAFQKVDQSMADVLLNGFSASNYTDVYDNSVAATGPDGLAVFSASHSNNINSNTFRNLIRYPVGTNNPALSREAVVQARVDALNYQDPLVVNRPIDLDLLIVSPTNEDLAMRITQSDKVTGSSENDINPLKNRVKVLTWSRLNASSAGTDTSAYWFLASSKKVKESLQAVFAEKPSLDPPDQVYKTKNWEWTVDFYYALLRGFPAYLWGSTGAN